jgi:hypothetical protein
MDSPEHHHGLSASLSLQDASHTRDYAASPFAQQSAQCDAPTSDQSESTRQRSSTPTNGTTDKVIVSARDITKVQNARGSDYQTTETENDHLLNNNDTAAMASYPATNTAPNQAPDTYSYSQYKQTSNHRNTDDDSTRMIDFEISSDGDARGAEVQRFTAIHAKQSKRRHRCVAMLLYYMFNPHWSVCTLIWLCYFAGLVLSLLIIAQWTRLLYRILGQIYIMTPWLLHAWIVLSVEWLGLWSLLSIICTDYSSSAALSGSQSHGYTSVQTTDSSAPLDAVAESSTRADEQIHGNDNATVYSKQSTCKAGFWALLHFMSICIDYYMFSRVYPFLISILLRLIVAKDNGHDLTVVEWEPTVHKLRLMSRCLQILVAWTVIRAILVLYLCIRCCMVRNGSFLSRNDGSIQAHESMDWLASQREVNSGEVDTTTSEVELTCVASIASINMNNKASHQSKISAEATINDHNNNSNNHAAFVNHLGGYNAMAQRTTVHRAIVRGGQLVWIMVTAMLLSCVYDTLLVLPHWPEPSYEDAQCDPLDETACILPYPSFYHVREDATSQTGYRVELRPERMPRLKGNRMPNLDFFSELDGFGTMGPILFYFDGLKEAYEAGNRQLPSADRVEDSITLSSATLLVDVTQGGQLVPHHVAIDYLDLGNPLVFLVPATPLHHQHHYAVAVINARSADGELLRPTRGMISLLRDHYDLAGFSGDLDIATSPSDVDHARLDRYVHIVIPALESAAPWFSFADTPNNLQLLFDFPTASSESQLGPARRIRDTALEHVRSVYSSASNVCSDQHVQVKRIDEHDCDLDGVKTARIIHAEVSVPWFLSEYGPGSFDAQFRSRWDSTGSALTHGNEDDRTGDDFGMGWVPFTVQIPCSLRASALAHNSSQPVRAVVEFGHGILGTRNEAFDDFIQEFANEEQYIILAMDCRGFSSFDYPLVIKVLLGAPHLTQSLRDHAIQGFVSRMVLHEFARSGMLDCEWMQFTETQADNNVRKQLHPLPKSPDIKITHAYYGISMGGIFGAGYTALIGSTGVIDRAVLTAAGTPFTSVIFASDDAPGFVAAMSLGVYKLQHVRIFMVLMQLAFNILDGSSALTPPLSEPLVPTLLQASAGDTTVSTATSEDLARAYNARVVSAYNRDNILGIPSDTNDNTTSHAVLTELFYEDAAALVPVDNRPLLHGTSIHICSRWDPAFLHQLTTFISTGEFIDPCADDFCYRNQTC